MYIYIFFPISFSKIMSSCVMYLTIAKSPPLPPRPKEIQKSIILSA